MRGTPPELIAALVDEDPIGSSLDLASGEWLTPRAPGRYRASAVKKSRA